MPVSAWWPTYPAMSPLEMKRAEMKRNVARKLARINKRKSRKGK